MFKPPQILPLIYVLKYKVHRLSMGKNISYSMLNMFAIMQSYPFCYNFYNKNYVLIIKLIANLLINKFQEWLNLTLYLMRGLLHLYGACEEWMKFLLKISGNLAANFRLRQTANILLKHYQDVKNMQHCATKLNLIF